MMRRLAGSLLALAIAGCATKPPEQPVAVIGASRSSLADIQVVTSPGGITASFGKVIVVCTTTSLWARSSWSLSGGSSSSTQGAVAPGFQLRRFARMRTSKAFARRATAAPIAPSPTMPTVAPESSRP